MRDSIIQVSDNFWNVRGTHRVLGAVDVGTQTSLVHLEAGDFVLLDSYLFGGSAQEEILSRTDGGRKVTAIVNLHPFHTVYVRRVAAMFPQARLFGTARHHALLPELKWEPVRSEDAQMNEQFPKDLSFSVPPGVDFIPDNENYHFASVLAFHPASQTLHVDDTLLWSTLPLWRGLQFHPTLGRVLQRRAGAVAEFRSWAGELVERCRDVRQLCTAHMRTLPPTGSEREAVSAWVAGALSGVERTLAKHEKRFG